MVTAFTNATIFTGTEVLTGKALLIEQGKIRAIIDESALSNDLQTVDCQQQQIAPGLIDLQIYGGGGTLFSCNPSVQALKAMTDALPQTGTTGFLVTLATNSAEVFKEAIRVVRDNPHPAVLGLHLEGPYINPVKKGAHPDRYIRRPDVAELRELLAEADGVVKMITLAPEVCGEGVIRFLKNSGVVVSAGHSNACFEEAVAGFREGITAVTHLFNAMSPLHHRNTGLPGAAFQTESVYASIIADGIHVDFNALAISKQVMRECLFLITDAVEECQTAPYIHVRKNGYFTLPDGTLSGSQLTLLKAVQNCVRYGNIPLEEALRMASAYPASVIGAAGMGRIAAGYKANLIVFSKDFELTSVYVDGALLERNHIIH